MATRIPQANPVAPVRGVRLALGRPLAIALAILCATTSVFVEAFHAPGPRSVRVGVVGPPSTATTVQHVLDLASPGGFLVQKFTAEAQARNALLHTQIRGVLVPGVADDRAIVAQAYGVPETQAVTGAFEAIAAHSNRGLRLTDAVPLPAHDRLGLSSLFVVVGTLLPSLAFGALLAFFAAQQPWWRRWGAILAYTTLAALVVALNADVLVGALTGRFLGLALAAGLLALAVASTTHGLIRCAGPVGLLTAVALFLILGLPSSGGAVTHELQPGFYGAISQWLPPGAALTGIRNIVYFDWAGSAQPLLVLAGWAVAGFSLAAFGERAGRYRRVAPSTIQE